MKKHLTNDQLIRYQFDLDTPSAHQLAAGHLADCPACRDKLRQLQRKFSALDLLKGQVTVSETLINQTLNEMAAAPAAKTMVRRFYWPTRRWSAATAAVLIIAGGLFAYHFVYKPQVPVKQELAKNIIPSPREKTTEIAAEVPAKAITATTADSRSYALKRDGMTAGIAESVSKPASQITEKLPFIPASNIELVTLPTRQAVQLTIYNSADLTLVRDQRALTLKEGWNWLQFMWAGTLIDPTSLELEPKAQPDKIEIQQLVYPAGLKDVGRWLIYSHVSGQVPFEITYLTSGLSWRSFYMGTLAEDEKTMRLENYVRVTNGSGEDYANAQTRLIVGKVHLLDEIAQLARREYPYDQPGLLRELYDKSQPMVTDGRSNLFFGYGDAGGLAKKLPKPKEIIKEGLSEYFLYTIEGTETIPNGWGKRLPSLKAEEIPVESLYKYDEERWGNNAIRFITFANDKEHRLGETPLPNGEIKIYRQVNEQGNLAYVGAAPVKYIPVDEKVELDLGAAQLVKVEPVLMDVATENYRFDAKGNITGWQENQDWRITVSNARSIPAKVEITRGFGSPYWQLEITGGEVQYEKHDATHGRFTLQAQPRSEKVFNYTVTQWYGSRIDDFIKLKSQN